MILFMIKTYRFKLEWRIIELKTILQKWRWLKISQKYEKDIIHGYAYVKKLSLF